MKSLSLTLLLLLPASLQSVRHKHIIFNNQSKKPISLSYQRNDPGFYGENTIITDTIVVGHNETIAIQAIEKKSKKTNERFATLWYSYVNQKQKKILRIKENNTLITFVPNSPAQKTYHQSIAKRCD